MKSETKKKSVGSVLYDDINVIVGKGAELVKGGGILMAISFMFGMRIGDDSVVSEEEFMYNLKEVMNNNDIMEITTDLIN